MIVNGREIELSHKSLLLLTKFLNDNKTFIEHRDMYDYDTIKEFSDNYKNFLDKEEIVDDVLRLFLLELKTLELSYKITNNTVPLNIINTDRNYKEDITVPSIINKWIYECNSEIYKEKEIKKKVKNKEK